MDFTVLDEQATDMANLLAVISAERLTDENGNRVNDGKRIIVKRLLDEDTIADKFTELSESGEKFLHRHVVFQTSKDGRERTWFCTKRDEARAYVKKVKAADGAARYVTFKV